MNNPATFVYTYSHAHKSIFTLTPHKYIYTWPVHNELIPSVVIHARYVHVGIPSEGRREDDRNFVNTSYIMIFPPSLTKFRLEFWLCFIINVFFFLLFFFCFSHPHILTRVKFAKLRGMCSFISLPSFITFIKKYCGDTKKTSVNKFNLQYLLFLSRVSGTLTCVSKVTRHRFLGETWWTFWKISFLI